MDHKNVKNVVGGGIQASQVAELVDAYINEWTACHWGGAKKVTHTGSNPVLTTQKTNKMEFLYPFEDEFQKSKFSQVV